MNTSVQELNEIYIAVAASLTGIASVVWIIVRLVRGRRKSEPAPSLSALPRCACGAFASVAAPRVVAKRWPLDSVYGVPPRYVREDDPEAEFSSCALHKPVLDTKADLWIASVRRRYAELAATVASEAAAYTSEEQRKELFASLTTTQKAAARTLTKDESTTSATNGALS